MILTPREPHWGHVPLEVTARGLTTGAIPFDGRSFAIDIDFSEHRLEIAVGGAVAFALPLAPMSVARFYGALMGALASLGIEARIPTAPAENATGTPLDQDEEHAAYDPNDAHLMWRGFAVANRALDAFRGAAADGWGPVRLVG